MALACWPPRSPDLTPCDFFLWEYIKDSFRSSTSGKFKRTETTHPTTAASVDKDMLRSVWTELDNRIDICRVTKGSHIEHL